VNGLIVFVTNELGEHIEFVKGVDKATAGAIGIHTILGGSLFHHFVLALRSGIAASVGARVGGHVEAFSVGLENMDVGTVGLAVAFVHGAVVVSGDQVEAGNAARGNLADIYGGLDTATNELGLVDAFVVDLVSSHHEDSLVVLDSDGATVDIEN